MVTHDDFEQAPEPDQKPGVRRVFAAIAVIALGIFFVGNLTGPAADIQAGATTTTFLIDQPVLDTTTTTVNPSAFVPEGEPLRFTHELGLVNRSAIALLEHQGEIHLFTDAGERLPHPDYQSPLGLEHWISPDGLTWTLAGRPIATDSHVRELISTPLGLVAYGEDREGLATLWRSDPSGREWFRDDRLGELVDEHEGVMFIGAGLSDGALVVSGVTDSRFLAPTTASLVLDGLRDTYGQLASSFHLERVTRPELTITVFSPLGIPFAEVTASEIALDTSPLTQTSTSETLAWRLDNDEGWTLHDGDAWPAYDPGEWVRWWSSLPEFTRSGLWTVDHLDANNGNAAAIASRVTSRLRPNGQPDAWEQGDYTIQLSPGYVTVLEDGTALAFIRRWHPESPSPARFNPETMEIDIYHDDVYLTSVSPETLQAAAELEEQNMARDLRMWVLLHSTRPGEWSSQDISRQIGQDRHPTGLSVVGDRVVMAFSRESTATGVPRNDLSIWVARPDDR